MMGRTQASGVQKCDLLLTLQEPNQQQGPLRNVPHSAKSRSRFCMAF
jgi:hypothetical protein